MPFPDLDVFLLEAFSDLRPDGLAVRLPALPDIWTPVKRAKQREYRARQRAQGIHQKTAPWTPARAEEQRRRRARPEVREARNKKRREKRAKAREEKARGLAQSR